MADVAPTRMELLRVRQRVKLARKGHSLLKRKRDALIRAFFDRSKEYRSLRDAVHGRLGEAYEVLHLAQAVSGANRVKSLSFAARPAFSVSVAQRNLMGVRVPRLDVERQEGGFNASLIGTAHYVQESFDTFRELVPDLVKLAELEQTLRALAEEIRSTKRRVNALEHVQIPRLESAVKSISSQLAEQERESFVRLKHVKRLLNE